MKSSFSKSSNKEKSSTSDSRSVTDGGEVFASSDSFVFIGVPLIFQGMMVKCSICGSNRMVQTRFAVQYLGWQVANFEY